MSRSILSPRHVSSPRVAAALVCAAAVLPYLPTVDDYFVRDDFGVVQLLASKPAGYFPRWFYTSWMDDIWGFVPDEVRPIPAVSYQLTALPGDAAPWGHHVFNIALHAANGLLVLVMALRIASLRLSAATVAALVFALLPVGAESVAWITGRVDSMPALLYAGSFLLYVRWRDGGPPRALLVSVAVFAMALLTKQNAITLPATLVAHDVLVARRPFASFGARLAAYAPFVLLTAGYLALRYLLFGQMAREGQLAPEFVVHFPGMALRHLSDVVTGRRDASALVLALTVGAALTVNVLAPRDVRLRAARVALFFGPAWWLIGVAPVVVAGYESPRHVYLAAMGWAVLLGGAFERLSARSARTAVRAAAVAAAAVVLLAYTIRLSQVLADWTAMAQVSKEAVRRVEQAALQATPGTLLIASVPSRSWEWALPFAARPPFSGSDLTARVHVVSPWALHCCRSRWFDDTRKTLEAWRTGSAGDAVVVVRVGDVATPVTLTTAETPGLAAVASLLLELERPEHLDETLRRLIDTVR